MLEFAHRPVRVAAWDHQIWPNLFAKSGIRPAASSSKWRRRSPRTKPARSSPTAAFTSFPSASISMSLAQLTRSRGDRKIRPARFPDFQPAVQHADQGGSSRSSKRSTCWRSASRLRRVFVRSCRKFGNVSRRCACYRRLLAAQGSFPPVYVTVICRGRAQRQSYGRARSIHRLPAVSTGFRSRLITSSDLSRSVLVVFGRASW